MIKVFSNRHVNSLLGIYYHTTIPKEKGISPRIKVKCLIFLWLLFTLFERSWPPDLCRSLEHRNLHGHLQITI